MSLVHLGAAEDSQKAKIRRGSEACRKGLWKKPRLESSFLLTSFKSLVSLLGLPILMPGRELQIEIGS